MKTTDTYKLQVHKELIDQCLQGERKAQYTLYQLYSKAMFNTCYRIVSNVEEAEDVLQEAFINAFKNLHRFSWEATFGAWLKRIVINHSLNYIKKKKLPLVEIAAISEVGEMTENPNDNFDFDTKNISIQKVKEGIKRLPNGYRLVLSLYLLEGYDHKEIAEILEISHSTSKSQYNRAKKRLKQLLED